MRKRACIAAAFLVSACGSRTGLEASGAPAPAEGGVPSDSADVGDAPPAEDAPGGRDASSCGAPWVLFTLAIDADDGGEQSVQIYARRADGSGGHLLSLPVPDARYPSVSPDGTELLYTNSSVSALYLYRFADGSNRRLDTQGEVGYGSVSPDGRTVVFGDGQNLYRVGVETGDDESLVIEPQPNAAGYPVFTQDSLTVLFGATSVLQSIHVDGTHTETLLTESTESFPNPTLSPDYRDVAAVVSCGGPPELRVYPFDSLPTSCDSGRIVAELPASPYYYAPSWGPSGLIAYAGNQDVFLVPAAGGKPTVLTADLTNPKAPAGDPTWAPACAPLP